MKFDGIKDVLSGLDAIIKEGGPHAEAAEAARELVVKLAVKASMYDKLAAATVGVLRQRETSPRIVRDEVEKDTN